MKSLSEISVSSLFIVLLLHGCMYRPGDGFRYYSCGDPSSVAIISDDNLPNVTLKYDGDQTKIDLNGPAKGALKGTMYGSEFFGDCAKGISGDGAAFFLSLCFLAVPVGAVIGGLTGVYSDDTEETLTDGDPPPNISNEVLSSQFNNYLTNLLLKNFGKHPKTSFVSGKLDEEDHYYPISQPGLDAAMVVDVYSIDFIGSDDLWGDFRLHVKARAKLFIFEDGQNSLYSNPVFECRGEKRTLIEWSSNDFRELHQSLKVCLDKLAHKIEENYLEHHGNWCG